MFELVKKIENLSGGVVLNGNRLIGFSGHNVLEFEVENFKIVNKTNALYKIREFAEVQKGIVGISSREILYFDSNLRQINKDTVFGIGLPSISPMGKLVVGVEYDYSLLETTEAVFDLTEKKIIWEGKKGDALRLVNEEIFAISSSNVSHHNMHDGSINWNYKFDKVQSLPTVYFGNKKGALIGFGEESNLCYYDNLDDDIKWSIETFNGGILVDSSKCIVHQLLTGYIKYDLLTGEILNRKIDPEYFSNIGIESQRSNYTLVDNYIITTDRKKGKLGAFNTDLLEFEWTYGLEEGYFPSSKKVKWHDPFLLIEDSKKNLFIFKRILV